MKCKKNAFSAPVVPGKLGIAIDFALPYLVVHKGEQRRYYQREPRLVQTRSVLSTNLPISVQMDLCLVPMNPISGQMVQTRQVFAWDFALRIQGHSWYEVYWRGWLWHSISHCGFNGIPGTNCTGEACIGI
eukprot:490120-Rhodomonas_salina.2